MANLLSTTVSGNLNVTGASYLGIIYDYDDNGYYLNPNATSVLNSIRFGTSTNNGTLSGSSDWGMRLTTDAGYIQFGPANGSFAHIYTDRGSFYFNKDLSVNGSTVIHSGSIGSQSVAYASDAGSVDGIDSSRIIYGDGARGSMNTGSMDDPNQKSGFHFSYNPTGRPYEEWWNWITIAGNGWQSSNNYQFQLAHDFHNDAFYVRRMTNGNAASWRQVITSGNISSQSVNYASSAGSVAWTNVSSRPTALSQFTNDLGNYGGFLTTETIGTGNTFGVVGAKYQINDTWLRVNSDNRQYQVYGNSRTILWRTDGATNDHGGGAYAYIWYYGGSADGNRRMISDTNGDLWTNTYGWLHDYFQRSSTAINTSNIGNQSVAYATNAGNSTTTSQTTFSSLTVNNGSSFLGGSSWFGGYGSGSGPGLSLENQSSFARFAFWGLDFYDWNNGIQMTLDNGYVSVNNYLQAGNSLRAPIFYDSQDTSFYLDPNSSSTSLKIAGGIAQNNLVGRPFAVWGASGGATGAVVIKFPGGADNYGMIHAVIDIYEYSGNDVSTVIIGGHNWNSAWYSYGAQVIGSTNKQIRVAVKDGKYCIVIGDGSSSWSYGQVVLRKIQNGAYYGGIMDVSGGYTAAIESDSYSWVSGDLRNLETPLNFSAGGTIYASGGNSSNWNSAYGWGNHAGLYQPLENQRLSTTNQVRFSNTYTSAWFRNDNPNTGLYNESTTMHWSSNENGFWDVSSTNNESSIRFYTGGHKSALRGYVYSNNSNQIGFLNNGGGWNFRTNSDKTAYVHGQTLTINADNAAWSSIYMNDGDQGMRELHCNSDRIGFLTQPGSWGSWCSDDGSWASAAAMYSPIYYDLNDNAYYLDSNSSGTSLRIAGLIETTRSSGTMISHASMSDAFGYNTNYGTYIGSPVGGTYYLYANGTIYDNGTYKTLINSGGGQTIGGITYFSNVESLQLYGIRGRFTNEYIHLYNKVGIGHPNGWGQGEGNTPNLGLSTYGGMNIAYGNGASSSINGYLRINQNWGGGDYGTEQLTIRGTYPSITLRSTTHDNKWLIHNANTLQFYNGSGADNNNWDKRFEINSSNGNIWMSWGGWLSDLLDAKQNASTAINTSNIGSQSVSYASSAGNADTVDGRHADYFYPNYTDNGYTAGDINGATAHQRIWGTDSVQNLIQFNPPSTVEFSLDGVNWSSTSISNGVFSGKMYGAWGGFPMRVGNNVGGWRFVRMTWVNFGYRFFSHFTLGHSTNGHSFNFVFQKSDLNGNNFTEVFRRNGISSWPGYTFTKHENVSGWWDTRDIRMVFELNHAGSADNSIDIGHIGIMGSYGNFTRLYDWDGDRNLYFFNNVTANNNITAGTLKLANNFTISQGNSDYASVNSWINLQGAHGLFSTINGAHIYPNNGDYGAWRVAGSRNGYNGIQFDANNGNVSLMVNTGSNLSGFHNNTYGWQIKYYNGTLYVGKNTYGGGTEAVVLDSSNYTNYITNSSGGGGGIHILTKPQSGWKYSNYTDIYNSVTNFNTAGAVICSLFYPATDISVSDVFINVVTAATNPTRGKIVIYSDEDLGYPHRKILESSPLDLTTTGLKTFVVNFDFLAGKKYWLGFTADDNDSTLRLTSPGNNANYIRHFNNINITQQAMYVPTWPGDFNNIPDQNTSVQTTSNGSVTVFFTAQ